MSKSIAGWLLAAVLPLTSLAQEAAPGPPTLAGSHARRHVGLFVRPELGVGYLALGARQGGTDVRISVTGASVGLAIGGAVSENLIVAGQVWNCTGSTPSPRWTGEIRPTADGSKPANGQDPGPVRFYPAVASACNV